MLKFKLEATSISSTVHVRRPDSVGGWHRWFQQVSETIGPIKEIGFRKFWWISWILIFRPTPYHVPHFILPQIARCPALFSRIFFPAFYPLALPHPVLPLFTKTLLREGGKGAFYQHPPMRCFVTPLSVIYSHQSIYGIVSLRTLLQHNH